MAQNKTPGRNSRAQGSKPRGKKPQTGSDRTVVLALAGFTGLAIIAIAAFAIYSTGGFGGGGSAENFTPNNQDLLSSGSQAPEFTTDTVGGGSVSVGGDGGDYEATMLVFFASWCPHCQNEAPIISDLEDQYGDLRVVMVGIDGQDNPQEVQQFVNEYNIESPAVYQPSLGQDYQVSGYPTVYFLDGNDEIVAANSGEAPRDWSEARIEEALG